jgi:hypothetical protein
VTGKKVLALSLTAVHFKMTRSIENGKKGKKIVYIVLYCGNIVGAASVV